MRISRIHCFHCQQAAEKALKALAALGKQCADLDQTMAPLVERLDDLTEYAWAYRYPTNLTEPSPSEVDEARVLAREIVIEVSKRLPIEIRRAAGLAR